MKLNEQNIEINEQNKIFFIFLITQAILVLLGIFVLSTIVFSFIYRRKKFKNLPQKKIDFEVFFSELKDALNYFSRNYIGALIIFTGKQNIQYKFASNGLVLNCEFTSEILKNIFAYKMSQLHDGAVILNRDLRIYSVQAYVEISKKKSTFKEFGLRHNAAYSAVSDSKAMAIAVSEKDGAITLFFDKNTRFKNLDWEKMKKIIKDWNYEQQN